MDFALPPTSSAASLCNVSRFRTNAVYVRYSCQWQAHGFSLCVYVLFVIHAKCTNRLNTRMKYALYVQMCAALFCGCTNEWEIGSCLIVSDAVHVNVPKLNSTIFPCHFSLSKIAHIANTYCHIYIQKANRY